MNIRAGLVTTLATIGLAGCFTSTADFKTDAEEYIASAVAEAVETTFDDVTCVAPLNQDVGTRFTCSALDSSGGVWEFDNVIDSPGEFTVNIARRP